MVIRICIWQYQFFFNTIVPFVGYPVVGSRGWRHFRTLSILKDSDGFRFKIVDPEVANEVECEIFTIISVGPCHSF